MGNFGWFWMFGWGRLDVWMGAAQNKSLICHRLIDKKYDFPSLEVPFMPKKRVLGT